MPNTFRYEPRDLETTVGELKAFLPMPLARGVSLERPVQCSQPPCPPNTLTKLFGGLINWFIVVPHLPDLGIPELRVPEKFKFLCYFQVQNTNDFSSFSLLTGQLVSGWN